MRRGLDDRPPAALGVLGLEDARADEHALGPQLHDQRGVRRRGDPTGAEHDDRQAAGSGRLAEQVEPRPLLPRRARPLPRRDAPPSRRMSAGTRSRAMTAAAPDASATFACSGVTTSMITPPLSISASPALTRNVASSFTRPRVLSGKTDAGDRAPAGHARRSAGW